MKAATVAFVGALVYRFPVLRPLLQEHLDDQKGEVLPHLFIADVERWVETGVKSGDRTRREQVRALLDFLETAYSQGDADVEELISVSFLEHLPRPEETGSEIRSMVGPVLAEQLRVIG